MPMLVNTVLGIVLVIGLIILSGLRLVREYERAIVFTLGRYTRTSGPGVFWILPLFENIRIVDIRTITVDVQQQETITRDSVTVQIDAVLWFRVTHPRLAIIAVQSYHNAVNQVALTSLRNIIGQHDLDEILRERDRINDTLRAVVDKSTDPWGVKVEAIELKDVKIPIAMQRDGTRG